MVFIPAVLEGGNARAESLRDRLKVQQSFVLNVIAETPLTADKYASLEDRRVSTSKPVLG